MASSRAALNSAVTIGSLGAPAGCITARPALFDRLDEQALLFAVAELHDAGIRAAGLPVCAPIDLRKTGLVEVFLHEIVREERASVPSLIKRCHGDGRADDQREAYHPSRGTTCVTFTGSHLKLRPARSGAALTLCRSRSTPRQRRAPPARGGRSHRSRPRCSREPRRWYRKRTTRHLPAETC
jgi:hypothetical protein